MKGHIEISKPILLKTTPFSCFLASGSSSINSFEVILTSLFNSSKTLKSKYNSLANLWNQMLIANSSASKRVLAVITKDSHVIVFDTYKFRTEIIYLPIIDGMMICDIIIIYHNIFIGRVQQLLVLNWETKQLTGIDFLIPFAIKTLPLKITLEKQKKLSNIWKKRINASKGDYSGNFRPLINCYESGVEGVIGVLYPKHQYDSLPRLNKNNEKTNISTEYNHYVLYIIKLSYVKGEAKVISEKSIDVEYSENQSIDTSNIPCLILRTDHKCEMTIIGLNSSNRFYSQLLIFNSRTVSCVQLRSSELTLATDCLPNDRYGRTPMLIADISWTPNDLYIVVFYCANYFCILSCLGQSLSIVREDLVTGFCVVPSLNKESYSGLKVTDKTIMLFNSAGAVVTEYKGKVLAKNLWTIGTLDSYINKMFRLALAIPQLTMNPIVLETLRKYLSIETLNSASKRVLLEDVKLESEDRLSEPIVFTNPFPLEPNVSSNEILKKQFSVIESLRWSLKIPNVILEIMHRELDYQGRVLLLKSEPMYFMHITNLCKQALKQYKHNIIREQPKLYCLGKTVKVWIAESQRTSFKFEKKEAFLMLYCLIQFRNYKATSFNIMYIIIAELLKITHKNNSNFHTMINTIMPVLKSTVFFEKEKKRDFFKTDIQSLIYDKGTLYQSVFDTCEIMRTKSTHKSPKDNKELTEDANTNTKLSNKKQFVNSLMSSLLNMYEINKMNINFSFIKEITIDKNKHNTILLCNEENYMKHLYDSVVLLKDGKYDTVFKSMKELINEILDNELSYKTSLTLIIVFSCLLLTILTLIKGRNQYAIRLYEIPTFFYKSLTEENLCNVFDQLKIKITKPELELETLHSIALDCSNEQREMYNAVAILMQISEHELAIDLLTSSYHSNFVLLGLLILNNNLNENMKSSNDKQVVHYLQRIVDKSVMILSKCPEIRTDAMMIRIEHKAESLFFSNTFSTFILSSNRVAGAIVARIILPYFTFYLQSLLQIADIDPVQIINSGSYPNFTVQLSPFMWNLSRSFCGCCPESCQVFLRKYLYNATRASMFTQLLQEAIQILCFCLKKGIIAFSPIEIFKKNMLKVMPEIPKTLSEELKLSVMKLLKFLWQVALLQSIEGLNESNKDSTTKSLRLAGYLIRLSFTAKTEQQELEFIQLGIKILKSINCEKSNTSEFDSDVRILGNAFEVYTEKWDAAIKDQKEELVSLINKGNLSALKQLKVYMIPKKPVIEFKDYTKIFKQHLNSDILFYQLLRCLKEINNSNSKESYRSIQIAKETTENLRKAINWSLNIIGIPRGMALDRKGIEWTLKEASFYQKSNDESNEQYTKLEENFQSIDMSSIKKLEEFGKHCTILNTSFATFRISHRNCNTNNILSQPHTFSNSTFHITNRKSKQETYTKTFSSYISTTIKRLQSSRNSSKIKYTLKSLVPTRGKKCGHKKSLSLATRELSDIKPFALYSVKKDYLPSSGLSTQTNVSPRNLPIDIRISTEEIAHHNIDNSVIESKSFHRRMCSHQSPFALVRVPSQAKSSNNRKGLVSKAKLRHDLIGEMKLKVAKISREQAKMKATSNFPNWSKVEIVDYKN